MADTSGDHWHRSYIWNSGLFKISDNARFSLDFQGKRSINNYSICAFDDDFDFEVGGLIAYVANAMLEPQIDPWKIGRKVNIHFVDTGLPTRTYTASDYLADGFNGISHVVSGGNSLKTLPAGALSVINELWVGGVTQTIYQGKPIIYGAADADTISASQLDDLPFLSSLRLYGKSTPDKGVAIIAGGGNDDLIGSGNGDQLSVGKGNDTIEDSDGLGNIKDMAGRRLVGLIIKLENGS